MMVMVMMMTMIMTMMMTMVMMLEMMMTSVCGRNKDQRARNNQAVGADSFHHQSVETQTQTSITKYKSIFADFEKIPKINISILGMNILLMTMVTNIF